MWDRRDYIGGLVLEEWSDLNNIERWIRVGLERKTKESAIGVVE